MADIPSPVSYSTSNMGVQVTTWMDILRRLVISHLEELLFIVRDCIISHSAKLTAAGVRNVNLNELYNVAARTVINDARDDQIIYGLENSKDNIRQVLHMYIKCYTMLISTSTDTTCQDPIVVPSVQTWFRGILTATLTDIKDAEWIVKMNLKNREKIRKWLSKIIEIQTQSIIPISIFKPQASTALTQQAVATTAPVELPVQQEEEEVEENPVVEQPRQVKKPEKTPAAAAAKPQPVAHSKPKPLKIAIPFRMFNMKHKEDPPKKKPEMKLSDVSFDEDEEKPEAEDDEEKKEPEPYVESENEEDLESESDGDTGGNESS
jgi:hypothetical protein